MCLSIPIKIDANRIFSITIESDFDVDCLYLVSVCVQNSLLMLETVFIFFLILLSSSASLLFFYLSETFQPQDYGSNCSSRTNWIYYYLWELIFSKRKPHLSIKTSILIGRTICEKLSIKTIVSNKLEAPHKSCILT